MLEENDNGSRVDLNPSEAITIRLRSNPSTGYRWRVAEIDHAVLRQVGEGVFLPAAPDLSPRPGASGREEFRFEAVGPGDMTLKLIYARSWEEVPEPQNTFSLQVEVR